MLITIPYEWTHDHKDIAHKLHWGAPVEVYDLDQKIPEERNDAFMVGVAENPESYIRLIDSNSIDMLLSKNEWGSKHTIYNIHRAHYRYVEIIQQEMAHVSMQKRIDQLNADFKQGLLVVANLLGIRHKPLGEHTVRVATLSKIFARLYKLPYEEETAIYQAALMHDIGLLAMPDEAFKYDMKHMDGKYLTMWHKHADLGAQIMNGFPWLHKAAEYVRSHHERYDGKGTPLGLAGQQIPPGSMIISLTSDYDDWQRGHFDGIHRNPREALVEMTKFKGTRYDPQLFDFFVEHVLPAVAREQVFEEETPSSNLEKNMKLSRDIFSYDGVLLLASGRVLNTVDIDMIRRFEDRTNKKLSIWIKTQ